MWTLALDSAGGPQLPGSNSCKGGCRGVVQINNDGTWSVNQEFYAMAQASKAILPRDSGGPWGQRIGVSVGGNLDWTLVVGAYVTRRVSSSDQNRFSLVVLNWYVFSIRVRVRPLRRSALGTTVRPPSGIRSLSERPSSSGESR